MSASVCMEFILCTAWRKKNVLNNARYELMDRTYFLPDRPINRWPAYFGQTSTYACTLCNVKERIDVRAWSYACARTCALPSARLFCLLDRSANQCALLQFTLSHFNVSVDFIYRFVYDSQFNFKYKSCRVLYMLSVYE